MTNDANLWTVVLVLAVGTLFLLCLAIRVEWGILPVLWRRVLAATAAQQAAIAYVAVDAANRNLPAGASAVLLAASLVALAITTGLVLWSRRHDLSRGRRVRR